MTFKCIRCSGSMYGPMGSAENSFKTSIVHSTIERCPVSWGCRIHQLLFCRRIRFPKECPVYDTKQSHDEVTVMLEIWGMQSATSLSLIPGTLWPVVLAADRVLSMCQIVLN